MFVGTGSSDDRERKRDWWPERERGWNRSWRGRERVVWYIIIWRWQYIFKLEFICCQKQCWVEWIDIMDVIREQKCWKGVQVWKGNSCTCTYGYAHMIASSEWHAERICTTRSPDVTSYNQWLLGLTWTWWRYILGNRINIADVA